MTFYNSMKKFTVSIIGCGSRGCDTYGHFCYAKQDEFSIAALCDTDKNKLVKYAKAFNVGKSSLFTDENEFFAVRRSDALVIATLDKCHVRQCLRAIELGYDILLEKPISDDEAELNMLLAKQKEYGNKIIVCHVLRYAHAFMKIKQLLSDGVIGRLVDIDATEQVAYWHYAHSYVRGNWRRSEETTPMILAKCCHDLDLFQYYAGSKAESVSSIGSLSYFNAENMPDGAAARCSDCQLKNSCQFNAYRIYIERFVEVNSPDNCWPYNVVCPDIPVTVEKLSDCLKKGPYGRCVFACDNNVVDNQITQIHFKNGVNAVLKMISFTHDIGRIMKFYGTKGELVLNETVGTIEIKVFGEKIRTLLISDLCKNDQFAHGGGDAGLVDAFYDILCGKVISETSLENSVESHIMGIAAEKSRLQGGRLVTVHQSDD